MSQSFYADRHAYADQRSADFAKAVLAQDVDAIKKFAAEGQNVEVRDHGGLTLLHIAASEGKIMSVIALLKAGADKDAKGGPSGYSALHFAVYGDHLHTAQAIVNITGKTNQRATYGETPLEIGAYMGRTEICYALVRSGAEYRSANTRGETPRQIVLSRIEDLVDWTDKARYQPLASFFTTLEEGPARLRGHFLNAAISRANAETVDLSQVATRAPRSYGTKH